MVIVIFGLAIFITWLSYMYINAKALTAENREDLVDIQIFMLNEKIRNLEKRLESLDSKKDPAKSSSESSQESSQESSSESSPKSSLESLLD
jgi:tetrahydromethanopterin S-methyltransferase subunit B